MSELLLNDVIAKLGYDQVIITNKSKDISSDCSSQKIPISLYINGEMLDNYSNLYIIKKTISILSPYSILFIENKPVIIFYDEENLTSDIKIKIWNFQIPFIIVNSDNCIKVYTSNNIPFDNNVLKYIETVYHDNLNLDSKYSFWHVLEQELLHSNQIKLDKYLMDNIRVTLEQLNQILCKGIATKLLLRLIFIRYLIDRDIRIDYKKLNGTIEENKQNLLNILNNSNELYNLFEHLKNKFNGNLFDTAPKEKKYINNNVLRILESFISGEYYLKSNQKSLFELYDFNIIPIEVISSIYEVVLNDETQNNDKAYYTPYYLADYIVNETTKKHLYNHNSFSILDPSCGSGIFLVNSARKIIEKNFPLKDDEQLISLITNNIYGIDKNEDAIDVAIFSLYITLLDYKDPKDLKNFKLPNLKNNNLFVANFFDRKIDRYLNNIEFDFILGNPPWGYVNDDMHNNYCKESNIETQNKEISRSFIYRTRDFASQKTICSLIVTSKLFYNQQKPAKKFRKFLLKECILHRFMELSAARKILFKNAIGPACIVSYSFNDEDYNVNNTFLHTTVKPSGILSSYHIITIEKYDNKKISQLFLLENDWAWKTLVYGSMLDIQLIQYLKQNKSLKKIISENNLICSSGIQINGSYEKDSSNYLNQNIIDPHYIGQFYIDTNGFSVFKQNTVHSNRLKKSVIFKNIPKVLILKGTTNKFENKAAYTSNEFLFPEAVRGICGNNKYIIQSIAGIMNSSLYTYLNLMLASSIGIEREQVFFKELLEYPVILDIGIAKEVEFIQSSKGLGENTDFTILNKKVLDLFNVSETELIDYALNIQIPIIKNKYKSKMIDKDILNKYTLIFTNYFNRIGYNLNISAINYSSMKYCDIIFKLDNKNQFSYKEIQKINNEIVRVIISKINNIFYKQQDIIIFGDDFFRIIKSNDARFWHTAIAKLDLADIVNSILLGE